MRHSNIGTSGPMTACGLCWTDCALLIYGDEQVWADASKEWQARNGEAHQAFAARAGAAVIGGYELEPTSTATSIRGDAAGPFLETKEGHGGYYLIEADDLDAAVALASLISEATAPSSGVEIRPINDGS